MKKISYLVTLVFLIGLSLVSCKDDTQAETEEQKNTRLLTTKTFNVTSVDRGGEPVDITGTPVTITYNTNNTFSVTGADALPAPFPASGNWAFSGSDFKNVTLTGSGSSAGQSIVINTLSDNTLIFTYDADGVKPADPKVKVTVTASR